ncbi:hypothetical protein RR48_02008 [Papilio machaon]|uniref:Uncharacterized protein n=1 Tax=Papilio machaon TaxID=76193 RepID=A0A0N1ICD8_PAPMA|nr:hypothetical protein RR48_02008 [Papilio machaon]
MAHATAPKNQELRQARDKNPDSYKHECKTMFDNKNNISTDKWPAGKLSKKCRDKQTRLNLVCFIAKFTSTNYFMSNLDMKEGKTIFCWLFKTRFTSRPHASLVSRLSAATRQINSDRRE